MRKELKLTHKTPVREFFKVPGVEGHVNIDGILGEFGIKPHDSVTRIHAEQPANLDLVKRKISSVLERFAPNTHPLFESAMANRYPQLTELSGEIPTNLTFNTHPSAEIVNLDNLNSEHINKINKILSKHSSFGTPSHRISEPINDLLRNMDGEHEVKFLAEKLIDSVSEWVPRVAFERGKEINPRENAGKELIRYLIELK